MKIVLIITRSDTLGGAQIHVRDLASALIQKGNEVTVLVGQQGPFTEELQASGVPFRALRHLIRSIHPLKDVRAILEIRRSVADLDPDLIAAHSSKAGWLARLAGWSLGVPVIFTAHGWVFNECVPALQRRFYALAERLLAPLASRIVTVSEYDRRLAMQYGVASQATLITVHNGIPDVPLSLHAEPGKEPVRMVMVARFSSQKDHATLVKALAGLRELEWQLDLIGDGPLREDMAKLAERLGLGLRVRFLGLRKDVSELISEAQGFLLISNCEGFPLSILEAMRAGLPVIASDVGGVREAVQEGETGFLIPTHDGEMLRERLIQLITDAHLRERLGAAGRIRYEAKFRFEDMLEKTIEIYRDVVQQARL